MGLESGSWISDLDAANPPGTDDRSTADDHLRLIKGILKTQFPNLSAEVGASAAELNRMDGILASTAELNKLNGATMSTAELNFLVGVLGAIIDTQGGQTIANLIISGAFTINGELILNAGYSEDADQYTATTGTRTLNTAIATYWYPSADLGTAVITFIFSNPAASGRVTSFTMELLGADGATLTWPTSVDWPNGTEPSWSAGRDIVSFSTRDNGTTWNGFLAGKVFS